MPRVLIIILCLLSFTNCLKPNKTQIEPVLANQEVKEPSSTEAIIEQVPEPKINKPVSKLPDEKINKKVEYKSNKEVVKIVPPLESDIDISFKQKELEAKAAITLSKHANVEITWAKCEADYFIIDYGFLPNALNKRIKVSAEKLSQRGNSYLYYLEDIPTDKKVYFAIQSISKLGRSKRSSVYVVKESRK